ncbi:LPS-assembly lipoprotein LptE [Zhongshania aliphaticivorans]|uniref:LPS-assembly lipoprotein LptE n=1 Tax=Zhongshania aliphaticivorans TaxID=1470434 RepID=A0A5S9N4Z0_9GAMM|nr:LPS assembly lipoprotein LptE [Zhongshania aliphaticivorans]CAA0083013.1 LPS-assembly lipoprotein LptE [Zhongshania aliphaticivorans]CAA0083782.1 LPS-assembly lipoprotein LptE [Zhongshania aliphaticivorans]
MIVGCGFTLRGDSSIDASLQPIYVVNDRATQELSLSLKRQFAINDVALSKSRKNAKLIVVVKLLDEDKRSVSLDNEARDAEYALFESASIELRKPDGSTLRGPHTLQQRRLTVNDPDNPIGEETEAIIVRAEMREQLSIRLARQVELWSHQLQEPH